MLVEVKGIRTTLQALKELDAEVSKEVTKGLTGVADELKREAQSLVPSGQPLSGWKGWRGGFNSDNIKSGIKRTTAKRRKRGTVVSNAMAVTNTTAAGVIWELAGRKSNGAPPRPGRNPKTGWTYGNGVGFVAKIRSESGQRASRLVWGAYDSPQDFNQESAKDAIVRLVDKATQATQAKLGDLSGG